MQFNAEMRMLKSIAKLSFECIERLFLYVSYFMLKSVGSTVSGSFQCGRPLQETNKRAVKFMYMRFSSKGEGCSRLTLADADYLVSPPKRSNLDLCAVCCLHSLLQLIGSFEILAEHLVHIQ